MRDCLIEGNAGSAVYSYFGGGPIENCTVVRNGGPAIKEDSGVPISLKNCIVIDNGVNLSVSNKSAILYSCCPDLTNSPAGTGNITNDPQFVRSGAGIGPGFTAGDFRLAETSPCRDRGTNLDWVATALDLLGNPRLVPKSGRVDMGAYEYRILASVFSIH